LNPGIVSSRTRISLKIGHVPEADRIVGRDEEISKLAKRLNGAVHGYSPENVMIYGKTGTGKSLVSKHVCQRAQNAAQDGVEIGTAYIDCAEDNTETQAISSLAAKLNDESSTGITVPIPASVRRNTTNFSGRRSTLNSIL